MTPPDEGIRRASMPSLLSLLASLSVLALIPGAARSQAQADSAGIEITWGVKIPLSDGVLLNATIFKPTGMVQPLPVILGYTPYISDSYHARGHYFAKRGLVFAAVDVRGRGNSDGDFEPFRNEGKDGAEVVEWLARQPWCDGQVAMFGGSYGGFDQWSILKEHPPHLKTIIPAAAAYPGRDFPFVNNIYPSYIITWLTFTSGTAANANFFGDSEYWSDRFRERYVKHLAYSSLDSLSGNLTSHFQTWLSHPTPDGYWDAMAPSPDQLRRVEAPILTITGHYDGDQLGAMEHYRQHMEHGNERAKALHYLVIGPWNHAGTSLSVRQVGELEFGKSALVDLDDLRTQWYQWHMKGGPRPEFLKKRVAYFVAGADEWKYSDDLESIASEERTYYLDSSTGRPTDIYHSGMLSPDAPSNTPTDQYTYDPLDTRLGDLESEEGKNLTHLFWGETPLEETFAVAIDGDGLVYHSASFKEDTEVSGFPRLVAWMSLDVPDTDFLVTLYEITTEGVSIKLSSDLMRARYRESRRQERLVRPGEINRYEFNSFGFFSRLVAAGSRLRLTITAPNSIHFQKNYNSGGVVVHETGADARTATVTLYHDAEHRSFLMIPVVR
jgi:putative CocE/NonD family hydrolase